MVELHVFYVPEEVWNFQLNTVPVALSSKFISAGFIRVSPHITLRVLREKLGEYLGGAAVVDKFKFLKCIGKKLAVVKAKQETELELKSFAPPYVCIERLLSLQQYRTSKCIADPGEKLDNQADENKQNHLICPREYISPPSPPFLSLSVNPTQVPSIQAASEYMIPRNCREVNI
ncbi:hypothetical protein Q9233_001133 [Columba guinea]|nr:hypothetical protein Q9233_001133 [Columba guinea]